LLQREVDGLADFVVVETLLYVITKFVWML